jgi:hypothetical protein
MWLETPGGEGCGRRGAALDGRLVRAAAIPVPDWGRRSRGVFRREKTEGQSGVRRLHARRSIAAAGGCCAIEKVSWSIASVFTG